MPKIEAIEIEYDELLKKCSMTTPVRNDLEWMLQRCMLESEPKMENGTGISEQPGKDLMKKFLNKDEVKKLFCDSSGISDDTLEKVKTDECQKMFWEFLSEQEEMEDDSWKKFPKEFIKLLQAYRHKGSTDNNISSKLLDFAKKINNDPQRYVYELIQNADDCEYPENVTEKKLEIVIEDKKMTVSYPEKGMTYADILAITTIGQSNKRKKKRKRIIGEKGIGFKTIFSICKAVHIHSGPYHFKLTPDNFEPEWIGGNNDSGTKMILDFKDGNMQGEEVYNGLMKKYGAEPCSREKILQNCPILFTSKIDQLSISYKDKKLIMQRNCTENEGEGGIKKGTEKIDYEMVVNGETETESLECIRVEQSVKFTYDEYSSHYKEIFSDEDEYNREVNREDKNAAEAVTYPVILLAPQDCGLKDGENEIQKGNLYTYLPTFSKIKAPLSIQIPFELNEDRSCMWLSEMKGDSHEAADMDGQTTKWNRRLFREVFESREDGGKCLLEAAFEYMRDRGMDVLSYLPQYEEDNHQFFEADNNKDVERLNEFCKEKDGDRIFQIFQNMELLQRLDGKGWIRFADRPVVFNKWESGILEKGIRDNQVTEADLFTYLEGSDVHSVIRYNIQTKQGWDAVRALGVSESRIRADKKAGYVNHLLAIDFDRVAEKLLADKKASVCTLLPDKKYEKQLKVIRVQTEKAEERWSLEDAEFWMSIDRENGFAKGWAGIDGAYSSNKWLAFYEESKNRLGNGQIQELFYDNPIWNKTDAKPDNWWDGIISSWKDKAECSFALWKEIMKRIAGMCGEENTGWPAYTERVIKNKPKRPEEKSMKKNLIALWGLKYRDFREQAEKEDLEQVERLGILCHAESERGKEDFFELPPKDNWTEGICKALNETSFERKYQLCDKDAESLDENTEMEHIFAVLKKIESIPAVEHIYIWPELKTEYVRFGGTVILKAAEEKYAKECLASIETGLDIVREHESIKNDLLEKKEPVTSADKVQLEQLRDICALAAKFNIDKRPESGCDNDIWSELLQNANDHIPEDAQDKTLYITIDSGSQDDKPALKLKYMDRGFSVRDFMAVCTSGNSGNDLSGEAREGRKGTGFKSIYNVFYKAVIHSRDVTCTLEDRPAEIKIGDNNKIICEPGKEEWRENDKKYYPIPQFAFSGEDGKNVNYGKPAETGEAGWTVIELYRRNGQIEMPGLPKGALSENEKQLYLFLDRIENVKFDIAGETFDFPKETYLKEHFIQKKHKLEFNEESIKEIIKHNPYWAKRLSACREQKKEVFDKKREMTILFPKPEKKDCMENSDGACVYCTLPVRNFKLNLPFYVNIPLLELDDSRKSLKEGCAGESNLETWNKEILKAALCGENSAFSKIFREFSNNEEPGNENRENIIDLKNLFQYFPSDYLNKDVWKGLSWKECLMSVPFIRTTRNGNAYEACSLNQWDPDANSNSQDNQVSEPYDRFVILPEYMYKWFHIQEGLDGFDTYKYESGNGYKNGILFLYYGDDTWNDKEDSDYKKLMKMILDSKEYSSEEKERLKKAGYAVKIINGESDAHWHSIEYVIVNYIVRRITEVRESGKKAEYEKKFVDWFQGLKEAYASDNNRYNMYRGILRIFCKLSCLNDKDQGALYQCIGNRELKSDIFPDGIELEDKSDIFPDGIELEGDVHVVKYVNICPRVNAFRKLYFSKDGIYDKGFEKGFPPAEAEAVKECFSELLEFPYLLYKRNGNEKKVSLHQEDDDIKNMVQRIIVEVKKISDKEKRRELLNEIQGELFCEKELFPEIKKRILKWIEKGGILYGSTAGAEIVPLTKDTYYAESGKIEDQNVVYDLPGSRDDSDELKNEIIKHLKNLKDEIGKKEFYEYYIKNEKDKLAAEVLNIYGWNDWADGVKEFLENVQDIIKDIKDIKDKNDKKDKLLLLFRKFFEEYFSKENEKGRDEDKTLLWNNGFCEIIEEFDKDYFSKKCSKDNQIPKPAFLFVQNKSNAVKKIPQNIKNRFNEQVSKKQADKILNAILGQPTLEDLGQMTLREFVEDRVYAVDCPTGNKDLYCWGCVEENGKRKLSVILFGKHERVFGKMLCEQFDCNEYEYAGNKPYQDMAAMELDELAGWDSHTKLKEAGKNAAKEKTEKIANRWNEKGGKEKDWRKSVLIQRFDICYKEQEKRRWAHARGYGEKKAEDRKCPVCGAVLLAEKSLLKIGYISHRYQEQNASLPMLMCQNCYRSLDYAERVYLKPDETGDLESWLLLDDTAKKEMTVFFDMYAMQVKEIKMEVTFLNRWLWYHLLKETEHKEQQ